MEIPDMQRAQKRVEQRLKRLEELRMNLNGDDVVHQTLVELIEDAMLQHELMRTIIAALPRNADQQGQHRPTWEPEGR